MGLEGIVSRVLLPIQPDRGLAQVQEPGGSCGEAGGGNGLGAMKVIHGAQFELSVDGVPRSYRDRRDLALQSAQILKARNPNSVVKLNDFQRGEEIVIAFKSGQQ
jgi:hypothetical protein